jgi:hypothetical protein
METMIIGIVIAFASYNFGFNAGLSSCDHKVQASVQALADVEDAVNANFSKVRGNKAIGKILVRWKDELK